MMNVYAWIQNGKVYEVIEPVFLDDRWIPLNERRPQYVIDDCVDITDLDPRPQQNWIWDGSSFSPPYVHIPTEDEIEAGFDAYRRKLMNEASIAMTPLLVSLNLGDATDSETLKAKEWQAYYRALDSLQITTDEPSWPVIPS